ncbi:hypothetical protein EV650_1212 [Kribbella kalugense]|uniref:Uncharacterized protein n=1 Tax=Kribbella kalugense TaxID=2512221 RepID=A0A4R7ZX77_9ACTN|nr:hypothetical protein EV650_1212 [Kribbella kalugense]
MYRAAVYGVQPQENLAGLEGKSEPAHVVVDDVEESLGEFRGLAELEQGVRPG